MLTHVVFMKFPSQEIARDVRDRLLGMRGKVPSLTSIEAGVDVTRSGRSWDVALVTRHDDQAGLEAYAAHPVHRAVLGFIKQHITASAAVDF
jgi:hypothetical protein